MRTQSCGKRSKKIAEETAGPDEFIQMAAVYKGKQIKLYRNGQLIADYEV